MGGSQIPWGNQRGTTTPFKNPGPEKRFLGKTPRKFKKRSSSTNKETSLRLIELLKLEKRRVN